MDFVAKQNSDSWFFWDTLINSLYFGSFPVSDLKKYGVHPDGTKKFLFVFFTFFIFQFLNDAGRYLTALKDFQYQNGKSEDRPSNLFNKFPSKDSLLSEHFFLILVLKMGLFQILK